ncbi:MAG: RNA-binding protein [Clostridiales bacterium]|jgi:ribosomal protein L14E/L6E/L27E|nr:RNA-binding protein [Clostridiales bacterium]
MLDMDSFALGGIVFSKRGRDKGKAFVVVSIEGRYLYLADGKLRKIEKPKKKKAAHAQNTRSVSMEARTKILEGAISDSDLKKVLKAFKRNEEA